MTLEEAVRIVRDLACSAVEYKAMETVLAALEENARLRAALEEIRREATVLFDLERRGMAIGQIADLCDRALAPEVK